MTEVEEIKKELNLPGDDAENYNRAERILKRAKATLKRKIGDVDFESDEAAKQLLIDCCRYIEAGLLDEFFQNYKSEILFFAHEKRLEAAADE